MQKIEKDVNEKSFTCRFDFGQDYCKYHHCNNDYQVNHDLKAFC